MSNAKLPEGIDGFCDERFVSVAEILARQIAAGEHHGAAVAAYFRGEPVVDIWGGQRNTADGESPWQSDTLSISFSTTKGIAATALHMAMERGGIDYDAPVASVWPEFGTHGKEAITIRQLLCHEAGVPQIRDQVPDVWALADWDRMVAVMESLEPLWEPGTANGYHAINFAWLIGETLRRIDGRDVPTFIAEEIVAPLGLDGLFLATPPSEQSRIAHLVTPTEFGAIGNSDEAFDSRIPNDSIVWKALAPRGSLIDFFNTPQGMSACIPSISGAFTARSVAKLYAALERGGEIDGVRILKQESVDRITEVQNTLNDFVLFRPARWRLGYMSAGNSSIRALGPHDEGYGHVGAGGTFGMADPIAEVSCALVYDKFGATELLGGPRSTAISDAVVGSAEACL